MSERPSERRVLAAVFAGGLAFMAATLLPYLYGRALAPPDRAFLWTHSLNSGDLYAYLGQIERVRDGELVVRNNFTIDRPNHGLLRPTYLLLGLSARASGLPGITVFHAGRIALGASFLAAFYMLAGCALERRRVFENSLVAVYELPLPE